jgi:cold shock CspA family protein
MDRGIVSLFNDIHGNGFIKPIDGSPRVRFSNQAIENSGFKILHEGQMVEFELKENGNDRVAEKVVPFPVCG